MAKTKSPKTKQTSSHATIHQPVVYDFEIIESTLQEGKNAYLQDLGIIKSIADVAVNNDNYQLIRTLNATCKLTIDIVFRLVQHLSVVNYTTESLETIKAVVK